MPEGRGLFEVARDRIRTRHLAFRTEQAYLQWMRRYVKEVEAFLTHLAVEAKVGGPLRIRRFRLCYFFIGRCSTSNCLGLTTSRGHLGRSGFRWCCRLRVKDLVISRGEVIVRDAKGGKDRVTVLPAAVVAPLREHLAKLFVRCERQRKLGEPGVSLPAALARKYPSAATEWGWQWPFPGNSLCVDVYTGLPTRHHQHEKIVQRAVQTAVRKAGDLAAGELSYLSALLCDASARVWLGYSHAAGIAGARRREDNHDLHACHG
jgi:hypothetical protein